MSETFVSRKEQIELSIEQMQALHSEQTNTNGNRALLDAEEKALALHVAEEEREAAAENKALADALEAMNLRANDVAAIGAEIECYSYTDGNTTNDMGTLQSEDFMWRFVTHSMGLHSQNRAGNLMNLNDIRYKVMPHLVNGKSVLSHVEELRKDDQSSNTTNYPNKWVWLFPLRNTTNEDKTVDIDAVMSSYSSNYSSAVFSILIPNFDNADPSLITDVTFQNLLYYTSNQTDRSFTQQITVPANTTILVMVVASARYYTDTGEAYVQNLFNNISLIKALEIEGIKIDAGVINNIMSGKLNEVHQIFKYYDGITNWTAN